MGQLINARCSTLVCHVPEPAAWTITALLTVSDNVIAPLVAGLRTPRRGRPPNNWTRIDRHYETPRREMQTLLNDLGVATKVTGASTRELRGGAGELSR